MATNNFTTMTQSENYQMVMSLQACYQIHQTKKQENNNN